MNTFYGDTSKIDMAFQCREDEPDRLRSVFAGKSVCLVANGESVLKKNYGALVEMHDVVVRMNAFRIEGFDLHVGDRTDVHAFTSFRALHDEEIAAGMFYCSDGFLDSKYHDPNRFNDGNLLFWSKPEGAWEDFLGHGWPTTGLRILIDVCNSAARAITMLGYDFFENSKYYYEPLKLGDFPIQHNPVHNPEGEKAYVEFLQRNDSRILKL